MFSQPRIDKLFHEFVTVRLFAGKAPADLVQVPDAAGAEAFRDQKLKNEALPYYVVLKPKGGKVLKKISFYEKGKIGSVEEFADFLTQSLAAAKK